MTKSDNVLNSTWKQILTPINSHYCIMLGMIHSYNHPIILFPMQHRINIVCICDLIRKQKQDGRIYSTYNSLTWTNIFSKGHTFHLQQKALLSEFREKQIYPDQQWMILCGSGSAFNAYTITLWKSALSSAFRSWSPPGTLASWFSSSLRS